MNNNVNIIGSANVLSVLDNAYLDEFLAFYTDGNGVIYSF